jgi:eukaryotic-like serine/threonine-protein kinase
MGVDKKTQKDLVLQEIRRVGDIPALADTVRHLHDLKGVEDQNITEIANIILKDYALTTKLLKVVNSVVYLPFGTVTTVSRAIFLLGIGQIRQIALTLMLLDHFQKQGSQDLGLEAMNQAFFSGYLARNMVRDLRFVEEEEGFICALLHSLGRILTAFALPKAFARIKEKCQDPDITETVASIEVLGISMEEISTTIATEWNFPPTIIQSMRNVRLSSVTDHPGEAEKLGLLATLTTETTRVLAGNAPKEEKEVEIRGIFKKYRQFVPVAEAVEDLINATTRDLQEMAEDLNLDLKNSSFCQDLQVWSRMEDPSAAPSPDLDIKSEAVKDIDALLDHEEMQDPETIFSKGIQDISNSLLQPYALNDVIRITLETIHRGMHSSRILKTIFLFRDTHRPIMKIRLGFGEDMEETKRWFVIECGGGDDIFNLAICKSSDLMIRDLRSPEVKRLIPSWYRKNIFCALYLILLPISVNKKNIGLICLEGEQSGFDRITKGHLNYLRILRDQIVLAITRTSACA